MPSNPLGRISAAGIGSDSGSNRAATDDSPGIAHRLGSPEPLREAGLRVGVEQKDPASLAGQRAGQVVTGRGLAHPAFLVQERDRVGHRGTLRRSPIPWESHTAVYRRSPGYRCRVIPGESGMHRADGAA